MPSAPDISGKRRVLITLYVIATFFYWMSQYLYVPTLPLYIRSKTENLALVGVVLSMYGLWQTIIRIPLGIAADWVGWRKPFLLGGVALAGLGAWTMGAAPDVATILIGRALTGLAAGTWVLFVVAFSRLFPSDDVVRATALLTLAGSIGRTLATGATGALNNAGGYSLAFFLAAGTAAAAVCLVLPIQEQRQPPQRFSFEKFGRILKNRDVLFPSVLSAISQHAIWSSSYGFIPILAKQLGATDVLQSVLLSMNIAVVAFGNMLTATLERHVGVRRIVYLSFVLMFAGMCAAALASSLLPLFVAQFCTGLAWGIGYPVLMGLSIRRVADPERATAMGIHQAIYGVGMFSGPWVGGILSNRVGIPVMLGVTALACLAAGLLGTYWFTRKIEHSSPRCRKLKNLKKSS